MRLRGVTTDELDLDFRFQDGIFASLATMRAREPPIKRAEDFQADLNQRFVWVAEPSNWVGGIR